MALLVPSGTEALRAVRGLLPPAVEGLVLEADDEELRIRVERDMLHLDADALHDRLHHWTLTQIDPVLPAASARLSFERASPATPEEASTLDLQEGWVGLEPTLALDLRAAREGDIERFAALVPRFLALIEGAGRPHGFRRHDVGTME